MGVEELEVEADILSVLQRDTAWAAYALSDLDPPFREHSRFYGHRQNGEVTAVALLFRTPGFVSLLPYGSAAGVDTILAELKDLPSSVFIAAGGEHVRVLEERFRLDVWQMYRMVAQPANLRLPPSLNDARRLTPEDLSAVLDLYGHWESTFFQPLLLETGMYFGIEDGDRLVSIAGTHTRSHRFRLGTIGGVFTHPNYRGRGLAKATTAAVAGALVEDGAELAVLNVKTDNAPALAAYRALGFRIHRDYLEGYAYTRCG